MSTSQAKILDYALKNCVFDGWNTDLLENACKKAGLDANYWRIDFPNGAIDVVDYFNDTANTKLEEFIPNTPGVTSKIRAIVRQRLENNQKYKQQIRSMLAVYALNPIRAAKATYRTTDTIWRIAGDTATDWNHYTKRMLLAGVYTSTLLYWLDDKSENNSATWEFLDRRLEEIGKFNKGMGKVKSTFASLKPAF